MDDCGSRLGIWGNPADRNSFYQPTKLRQINIRRNALAQFLADRWLLTSPHRKDLPIAAFTKSLVRMIERRQVVPLLRTFEREITFKDLVIFGHGILG